MNKHVATEHSTNGLRRRKLMYALGASLVYSPSWGENTSPSAKDPSQLDAACVIPAKAGGGFALTCELAREALQVVRPQRTPLQQQYLPGGIGAVAFDRIATGAIGGPGTMVAFSSGSLLNIAQGRFGPHSPAVVKWLAVFGVDYGVVAVHKDSPYRSLQSLVSVLKLTPSRIVFGAGGTVGSQDWVKSALLVRAVGGDHRTLRFVSFEGGGDALAALRGRHVDVFAGDAAEFLRTPNADTSFRLLAVLSPVRLGNALTGVPTALEQGVDVIWPTIRGVYLSAKISNLEFDAWRIAFQEAMASPEYNKLVQKYGLYPFSMTGAALNTYIDNALKDYVQISDALGLRRWR